MRHNHKSKRRKSSERRAQRAILGEVSRLKTVESRVENGQVTKRHGSFMVKRALNESSVEGTIRSSLKSLSAKGLQFLGASIINPRDAFNLIGAIERSGEEFDLSIAEEVVESQMNQPVYARILGYGIFGAQAEKPGMRYVGIKFGRLACDQLRQEREAVYSRYGIDLTTKLRIPHLSIFQTPDQHEAENVHSLLSQTQMSERFVELGPATITPATFIKSGT